MGVVVWGLQVGGGSGGVPHGIGGWILEALSHGIIKDGEDLYGPKSNHLIHFGLRAGVGSQGWGLGIWIYGAGIHKIQFCPYGKRGSAPVPSVLLRPQRRCS